MIDRVDTPYLSLDTKWKYAKIRNDRDDSGYTNTYQGKSQTGRARPLGRDIS